MEQCEEWLQADQGIRVGDIAGREDEVRAALEEGKFEVLETLPLDDNFHTTLFITHVCSGCQKSAYLQGSRVVFTADGKGGFNKNTTTVLPHLELSAEHHAGFSAMVARLSQPSADTPLDLG